MASIYDTVNSWSGATTYSKYSIVRASDSRYYYSVIDSNLNKNPTTTANLQSFWDGYILINGNLVPNFWWKPSYNARIDVRPRIKTNQFGNGYQQRVVDGINNNLVEFNLNLENRSETETVSILHFLQQRNGQESFIYNIPTIFSKPNSQLTTRFICPEWFPTYVSYNNYNLDLKFIEVPV